ncbi:inorganic phosphate transporter [Luteimonas yindakuii]|uniref:Phosphate transporter n=1 Tax=Luteimonas yindakuii TaxID=2565782 RepID=A0A4Z1R3R1_9GAMM|nr:inorganic phosphate transporter [Luteimonas yindakuii]QCO67960.1 inorganic phosphate transporter [Luteimonas yindakuii]TKS54294.1 inorganic phosphate transporter [Luteimonas yindakuii]
MLTLVLIVVLTALVFEYINGFHDTANSIATVVATKVLTPMQAVGLAASMNLIGALAGTAVAQTIASGLINAGVVDVGSQLILCALLGGIVWNLITWWFGLPSSSSHALIGGLIGAALAAAEMNFDVVIWSEPAEQIWRSAGVLWKVIVPMVGSPVLGFTSGFLMMGVLFALIAGMARAGGWLRRLARPRWVNGFFGKAQIVSAAGMGFAHGMNDAQKTMGIVALTLVSAEAAGTLDNLPWALGFLHPSEEALTEGGIDLWIKITCAVVMAAGTAAGGWRIIKTLGHKLVKLHPIHGFAAETSAASVILAASSLGIPVSTTHNISSAIMGVGTAKRLNAIKWGVVNKMVWAWILTIPMSGGMAYGLFRLLQGLGWA